MTSITTTTITGTKRQRNGFWMTAMVAIATVVTLSKPISALDLHIKAMECESRPVTVAFDYICNGDFLCAFGEIESMEGALIYFGLVDQFSATSSDVLDVRVDFKYHVAGYTQTYNIMDNVQMPLCNDQMEEGEYNYAGDCPADGEYGFDTVYNMPEVNNYFTDWAASGWNGEIEVQFALNRTADLVGVCRMKVQTLVSGSYDQGAFKTAPSAKAVGVTVFGAILIGLFVFCFGCGTAAAVHKRRQNNDSNNKDPLLNDEGEDASDYQRLAKLKKTVTKEKTYLV